MQQFDFKKVLPTVIYLQNLSKIVGKVQQAFIAPQPNEWHKGLIINGRKIETRSLGNGLKLTIDLERSEISGDNKVWKLGEFTVDELQNQLRDWAKSRGAETVEKPETDKSGSNFNRDNSLQIAKILQFASTQLELFKQTFAAQTISPVLLFPHHFDMSLVWYPYRSKPDESDERQAAFGFSVGDEHIPSPYFYVTVWPDNPKFSESELPPSAYWQKQGFNGAVLLFEDISGENSGEKVQDFLARTRELAGY